MTNLRQRCVPIVQQLLGARAAGVQQMALDQDAQPFGVEAQQIAHAGIGHADRALLGQIGVIGAVGRRDLLQPDHGQIAALFETAVLVEDIGDAARHAGGEIAPRLAQHHDHAAGHIFAAMIAGAFHHGDGAGIAHRETLARHAVEIGFAGDGAVQHGVADDDVLGRIAVACWAA